MVYEALKALKFANILTWVNRIVLSVGETSEEISMLISVIMSVFNKAPYLATAVESILNQSVSNFEFIIVNDGFTDSAADVLDRYARAERRVRVLHQANLGVG